MSRSRALRLARRGRWIRCKFPGLCHAIIDTSCAEDNAAPSSVVMSVLIRVVLSILRPRRSLPTPLADLLDASFIARPPHSKSYLSRGPSSAHVRDVQYPHSLHDPDDKTREELLKGISEGFHVRRFGQTESIQKKGSKH
jgi:hypothetical protein